MKRVMLCLAIIFLIGCVFAFTPGNPAFSIEKTYGPGAIITGWINLSLNNEQTNSTITDSFGESISLTELISLPSNTGFTFTCSPLSCASDYRANNMGFSKTLNLGEEGSVLVGFNLSGNSRNFLSDITDFSFNLQSNHPETEKLPVAIDLLNDGQVEWQSYLPSGNFVTTENLGCFTIEAGQANLATSPSQYCERVRLTKSAGVEIGAYVKGSGDASFDMRIQNTESGTSMGCEATVSGSGGIKRIACVPDGFSIKENGDYFVCIKPSTSDDANRYTIAYEQNSPCGFSGTYDSVYDYDFEIFAKQEKYAAATNIAFNNDELISAGSPLATSIEGYVENYISEMYDGNCSKGCIVPVRIISGVNQIVTVDNVSITYAAGISSTTDRIFDVRETPAKISSSFQRLYIGEAGFNAPMEYGNSTFSLRLNNGSIFSTQISVGSVPVIKSLTPTKTGVQFPTTFKITLNDSRNITEYTWDFGDGGMEITAINSVVYTYSEAGTYTLTVTLTDANGASSTKGFSIEVLLVSQIVPTLLAQAKTNLNTLTAQIPSFTPFEQQALNSALDIDTLQTKLDELDAQAAAATTEEQFEAILGELLNINLPLSLVKTMSSEELMFYPDGNNIDMNVIKEIGGGDFDASKEGKYRDAVLAWDSENTNIIMTYSEISAVYDTYNEPFLRVFDLAVTNSGTNAYLIIKDMANLIFREDYSEQKVGGYYYIDLISSDTSNNIAFSTIEPVDFITVPLFISPPISELTLAEWSPFTEEGTLKKWIVFTIVIILVFLIVTIIYLILQMWYKRKYENYLFKNRNNLYNIVTFIAAERKKETSDKDIAVKLKKAGWNSEQVTYALKKYAGKRTGMYELPIGKMFRRNKTPTNVPPKK